jgi:thiol-disulfide isomerase/thioredoxin
MRRTKTMWLGSLALLGLLVPGTVRADVDPKAAMDAMFAHYNAAVKEAQDKKIDPDFDALRKEVTDTAKATVKGVDPEKVEPAQGMAWAQLFRLAEEPQKMILSTQRFLTSNPTAPLKFNAQMTLLGAYDDTANADGIVKTIAEIKPDSPKMAIQLASMTTNVINTVADKKGAKAALALLKKVEALVPFDQLKTPQELNSADSVVFGFAGARAEILDKNGKRAQALAALEEGKKHLSPNSRYAKAFVAKTNFITIVGNPAPALKRERGYGEFTGLDAYKGKVVVLDFMAHWCGPCKMAFPDMKKMYNDLHSRGLEVVSVTTYYGFFDKEQKLTPDAEFAKMEGFVAKYGLTWPVVFGDASNSETFGVSGIPHFVIIDQSGKVNSITVGYSPDLHAKLRKTVEDLLNKKVALK